MFIRKQRILNKVKPMEGERLTRNAPIAYEFASDIPYTWIGKNINYAYSSEDLVSYVEDITGGEISHLDLKYGMELAEIKGECVNGVMYYPIKESGYIEIIKWANERIDKNSKEAKYQRMRNQIAIQI